MQFSKTRSLGIFLECVTKGLSPLKVKYAITIVNQEHPNKSIFRGMASKSLITTYAFGGKCNTFIDSLIKRPRSSPSS